MKRVALVLALAGCKADLHQTVDAQPLDTAVDTLSTETGDPPANAVKLKITRYGDPVPDVAVFFQNADSSAVAASLTNENGYAWAVMPSGGFVTAREKTGAGVDELTTFAGVQSTDALVLDIAPTGAIGTLMTHLQFPAMAQAASYQVHTPCGAVGFDTNEADIQLVGCGSTTDIVVVPLDADGGALGSLYAPGVSIDNATTTISGSYQPLSTVTLNYAHVPDFVTFVGAYEALSATQRAFAVTGGSPPSAGDAQVDVSMPASSGTELTASNFLPASGEIGQQTIYNWHPAAGQFDLDVAPVLLPPYATAPTFDPALHTLSWTERPGDQQPDVVRARIHVYRDEIPTGTAWSWRIVAARDGTHVVYPKLPIVDFDFNPNGSDTITVEELTTISLPGGFAGFHTHGFDEARTAISGTLGRIVEQTRYFEEPTL